MFKTGEQTMSGKSVVNVKPAAGRVVFQTASGGNRIAGEQVVALTPWIASRIDCGDLEVVKARKAEPTATPKEAEEKSSKKAD
jgi:hypothetical protein